MAVIWNPNLYLRNLTPRIRPALDLMQAAISALPPGKEVGDVEHIVDLGCGPGIYLNTDRVAQMPKLDFTFASCLIRTEVTFLFYFSQATSLSISAKLFQMQELPAWTHRLR